MAVVPYLYFNGRCEEAVRYYEKALGAKLEMMMRFKENPDSAQQESCSADPNWFKANGEKIMHASLRFAGAQLMLSDGMGTGELKFEGISVSVTTRDAGEAEQLFHGLAGEGQVQMPLTKTFFAEKFGMVADKFGVSWMIYVGQDA